MVVRAVYADARKLLLLVKPDASPEEIKAVVNDDQGGQIFSQAVRFTPLLLPRSSI